MMMIGCAAIRDILIIITNIIIINIIIIITIIISS